MDKKSKKYILVGLIGVSFVLLASFYGFSYYQNYQAEKNAVEYIAWLEDSQAKTKDINADLLSTKQFKSLIEGDLNFSFDFYQANLYAKLGQQEKASKQLKQLIAQSDLPQFFRSIAQIKLANYLIDWGKLDEAEQMLQAVKNEDQGKLSLLYDWVYATLYQKQGKMGQAKQQYQLISEKLQTTKYLDQQKIEPFLFILQLKGALN